MTGFGKVELFISIFYRSNYVSVEYNWVTVLGYSVLGDCSFSLD